MSCQDTVCSQIDFQHWSVGSIVRPGSTIVLPGRVLSTILLPGDMIVLLSSTIVLPLDIYNDIISIFFQIRQTQDYSNAQQ